LGRLIAGAREQERREAEAAVRKAEAEVRPARAILDRQRTLRGTGATSQQSVDQALADYQAKEAQYALLKERHSLLIAPPRPEDVAIAEANLALAKARQEQIAAQIEKTIIRSPIDGVVLKRYLKGGETVTNLPPTPIMTVGDTSRLRVRADVDEADVGRVMLGQQVWIHVVAFRDRRFRGIVARMSAQLGRKNFRTDQPSERLDTKVLEVLIDLEPNAKLPVGLRVDVIFDKMPQSASSRRGDSENAAP
jgi:HlyD family secretion protein